METAGILDGVWQTHCLGSIFIPISVYVTEREITGTSMVKNYWNMTNIVHGYTLQNMNDIRQV